MVTGQPDQVSFAQWLKSRRKLLDLTQAELARTAGCSAVSIKKIEASDLVPSKQLAALLATALQVPGTEHTAFVQFARSLDATMPIAAFAPKPVVARVPPAPQPQTAPAYNRLPAQMTSLVGRERELATLCRLLRRSGVRLMTLTGPAGIGKTRLSLEVALQLQHDFADGVCFVPLAPIMDAELVGTAIAGALGVREGANKSISATLQEFLYPKELLLVLDNFEQVVDGAGIVKDLLVAAPRVKALATSREILHLYGEQEFPVPALGLPDVRHLPHVEALAHYPAIELFVQRAQMNTLDFELDAENAGAVAEICAWLDGTPLAIEMAAARIKWSPPQVLLSQLRKRLEFLTDGPRDLTPRQQTLRGAIGWSYDLLEPELQQVFKRMAVFVGGATFAAIELVCNDIPISQFAELVADQDAATLRNSLYPRLRSLVEKSLLRHEPGNDGQERFWMLETIREYAVEQLELSGEAVGMRARHTAYFSALSHVAAPLLTDTGQQLMWVGRLEAEHNNLRAALDWAIESSPDAEGALRFADALFPFWNPRSDYTEGRRYLMAALARTVVPTALRARALNRVGTFAQWQGDTEEAVGLQAQALEIQEAVGDQVGLSRTLQILGMIAGMQSDYDRAKDYFERSLILERVIGQTVGLATVLTNLALVAQYQGDYAQAEILLDESLVLKRQLGGHMGIATSLHNLGMVRQRLGRIDEAIALLRESLMLRHELGDKQGMTSSLERLGFIVAEQQNFLLAARLLAHAAALREVIGFRVTTDAQPERSRSIDDVRTALGPVAFEAVWAEGSQMLLSDVVALAVSF